jgi:hypothetical protein
MSGTVVGLSLLSCTFCGPWDQVDREQLIRLIEGARPDIKDFAFEYEGNLAFPSLSDTSLHHPERLQGVQDIFTGTFARRNDGATLVEIYQFTKGSSEAHHSRIATTGQSRETSSRASAAEKANITIGPNAPETLPGTGNYARLFLSDVLLGMLRAGWDYHYEGTRDLNGKPCLVVRIRETDDPKAPDDVTLTNRFWIDLERGGHVVRHEQWIGGKRLQATLNIRLDEFCAPSGKRVWLPVFGQFESYVTSNPNVRNSPIVYTNDPVVSETYDLLEYTLRLERGLKDGDFSVKAKPGDVVSDQLRKARYEFGQYLVRGEAERKKRRVADSEIQQNLDRMLDDSEMLARELKASSPLRGGPGWSHWLPWGIAALASVSLVVLLVRRHFAG